MGNEPNYMTLKDKDYFSAYLNMARHNAFITLSHISKIVINEDFKDEKEEKLFDITIIKKLKSGTEIEKQKIVWQLNKYFKFLPAVAYYEKLKEKRQKEDFDILDKKESFDYQDNKKQLSEASLYYKVLINILKPLDNYRNYYSHFGHPEIEAFKNHLDMINYLNQIFDASSRICKQRFSYNENDIKHLRRYDGSEKDNTGKRMPKRNPKFFFNIKDEEKNELNTKGLAFYISMFLEKKYANDFLKKLEGFKDARTTDKQSTFEVYTALRLHLPKQKIRSDDSNLSIAIDMINELQKCPAELYDLLSEENQNKFRVEVTMRENADDYEENGLFKRFNDRFPYFALKYFDLKPNFPIRFHVDMGKYYFKFYEKQLVDGKTEIRKLDKNLKAFGKIADLDELRKKDWDELLKANPLNNEKEFDFEKAKASDFKPYIQDTYPHYHIVDNQIGLKFTEFGGCDILPNLEGEKIRNLKPDAWLSTYELVGMVFWDLLNKNSETSASAELLKNYYKKVRVVFTDINNNIIKPISFNFTNTLNKKIKDEETVRAKNIVNDTILKDYNINVNNLQEGIQRYLIGKSVLKDDAFRYYAIAKINKMLEGTESRLKHLKKDLQKFGDKGNKYGSKKFKDIKSGILADFLAKDMLAFQPSANNGKDKITGLNFQVLQANLAMYNENRELLTNIFKECKLIDSKIAHPFLANVKPENHLMYYDFYKSYLEARKEYLTKCRVEAKFNSYYFLNQKRKNLGERKQSNFIKKVTDKYLNEQAINFPRGLFCDAIRNLFKFNNPNFETFKNLSNTNEIDTKIRDANIKKLLTLPNKINKKGVEEENNTVFFIQKYFEILRDDSNQEFYDYKRSYKFINELYDDRIKNTNVLESIFFPIKDVYKNVAGENKLIEKGLESLTKKFKEDIKKLAELPEQIKDLNHKEKIPRYREPMLNSFNRFKDNEQILRLYKVQDITMLLMAENLLEKENINITAGMFKLKNIVPPDLVSNENKQDKADTEKNILNHATKYSIVRKNVTIEQDKLKIKNVGDFIRFTKDRRMDDLLEWYNVDYFKPKDENGNIRLNSRGAEFKIGKLLAYEINRLFLENEFAVYEKSRLEFLAKSMKFEELMFDFYKNDLDAENDEDYFDFDLVIKIFFDKYPHFKSKDTVNYIEDKKTKTKNVVQAIRNKFAHNQFPELIVLQAHKDFKDIQKNFNDELVINNEKIKQCLQRNEYFGKEFSKLVSVSNKIANKGIEILDKYIETLNALNFNL